MECTVSQYREVHHGEACALLSCQVALLRFSIAVSPLFIALMVIFCFWLFMTSQLIFEPAGCICFSSLPTLMVTLPLFYLFGRCIPCERRLLFRDGSRQENIRFLRLVVEMIQNREKITSPPRISSATVLVVGKPEFLLLLTVESTNINIDLGTMILWCDVMWLL